jgi:hydrogenase expression/formation protein HypC
VTAVCVAYPAQVLAVDPDGTAEVVVRGRRQRILLAVLPEPVDVGDWLLVQSGLALTRIDAADAADRNALLDQLTRGEP